MSSNPVSESLLNERILDHLIVPDGPWPHYSLGLGGGRVLLYKKDGGACWKF